MIMGGHKVVFQFNQPEEQRLDKFLVACLPDYSRSRLQSLIRQGCVQVGDQPAVKASQMLDRPQNVEVFLPDAVEADIKPEAIPLDIVFENSDLMIVNKPAGMVVHPAAGHFTGTLVHAALAHAPDIEGVGGQERPGVVHRLDKNTSGLIVLAKNDRAHRWLQDQFRLRKVEKYYLALVDGCPPSPTGRIETAIGRSDRHRGKMAVVVPNKGREAVSEYRTIEKFTQHTLLEVKPLTGRTHQIRLHLEFIGCPVAGDVIYGRKQSTIEVQRHFLHAARLVICLPGEKIPGVFDAPLPSELEQVLDQIRRTVV
jgi:23S rRNA pseudouridine1911/1915/1917 synthase